MNEHMRVGHKYEQVRQLLAYSYGLDDMDFLVAYEMDDLPAFNALVRDLRATDGRRSTVRDTPILAAIHRPLAEIVDLLGAVEPDLAIIESASANGSMPRLTPDNHYLATGLAAIPEKIRGFGHVKEVGHPPFAVPIH